MATSSSATSDSRVEATAAGKSGGATLLIARVLMCWIFVHSALGQIAAFAYWTGRAAQQGVPLPAAGLAISIFLELVGGLALLVGAETRIAAWALIVFLIPTSFFMHNFWALQGAARDTQENNFLRNMAILGGLLFVSRLGAGSYSLDAWRATRQSERATATAVAGTSERPALDGGAEKARRA